MGGWFLVVASAAFWAGILAAGRSGGGPTAALWLLVAGLGGCILLAGRAASRKGRFGRLVILAVAFGVLGAGWWMLREARIRASPLVRLAGRSVVLTGALTEEPKEGDYGWTASMAAGRVDAGAVGAIRLRDAVWLQGQGAPPALRIGDRVEAEGEATVTGGPFGAYLLRRGYSAILDVDELRLRGPPGPLLRAADATRSALRDSVARVLPAREAGLLLGLALGDTSRADPEVTEDFRATGLSHLTAVSGANVAMFLAPILGLATWIGLGRVARILVGLAALGFFVLLTRAEPSVLRAAMMAGLSMWGVFLGRPRSPPAVLGGAVLVLLWIDPTLVHSVGFQLSVAATGGIVLFATPVSRRLWFLPEGLALASGVTIGAQAAVTPLLLYHFGVVPTVTLPANLLAFPAVSVGMLLGLAAGIAGAVGEPIGLMVGWLARWPLAYLIELSDRMAMAPLPSITSAGGREVELGLGLAAVAVLGWWVRSGRRLPRHSVVALCLAVPVLVWLGAVGSGPPSTPTVTFFDVGQGDAALIRSPAGATVLIDAGPDADHVAAELAALGVRRIDLLVATHPHADHVAGLPAVLSRFGVSVAVDPGCGGDSSSHAEFLSAIRSAGVTLRHPRAGSSLLVGDIRVDVLGPEACHDATDSDANNDSLVLRVWIGRASVLFAGDAERPAQAELMERPLRALVLKVPHHGGDTSLDEFFDATDASVAVVSVGQPNRYGHPSPQVLRRLRLEGMQVLRTDLLGDVTVRFEGNQLTIESSGA